MLLWETFMGENRFELIIVTQHGDQYQGVPGGMGYVDEMIHEAGLSTESAPAADEEAWLPASFAAINRRFGRRVRVRLINPMSPYGLYLSFRFRFRGYPAVITPDGHVFVQPSIEELVRVIEKFV
jgi:hypothetical protein